ncbi:tail fiber assembly protein [Pantoea agglomerans]|uniref:tail fiber assembly protein n=1 Tax=Enterobacterales TaxID=91347 RepID=UPI00177CFED8|nr:tail fiber assembly protein [Pantoea agglomerans]MBD8144604.1 tail fiber assembly protein [Pantoea agglomerans]WVL80040.1 tail fiber assembly protein [Pantoea agglomerans]
MAKVILDENGLAKTDGTLTVYNFDAVSGEFTGSNDEYLAQGVGLPANACTTAPLITDSGHVALYISGSWQAVADHRGETVYSVNDGKAVLIDLPGDYPADTTPLKPATAWDKWDGEKWVTDPVEEKAAAIKEARELQAALIAEANSITQAWQTQLLLGIITDEDKATLTKWMKYIQSVQAIDINNAPDIIWPQKP